MADLSDLMPRSRGVPLSALGGGIAPYGIRHDGMGVKGRGFFGALPYQGGGVATEISSAFDQGGQEIEHPLLVPTLTADEIRHLIHGGEPTPEIFEKAQSHALMRRSRGESPFAGPQELRWPTPK